MPKYPADERIHGQLPETITGAAVEPCGLAAPGRTQADAPLIEEAYLYFECRHHKTVDGFGSNCLITGEIIAAYAEPGFLRSSEIDDQELVHHSPLFAYLAPGRFAAIERSNSFPFPANMKK